MKNEETLDWITNQFKNFNIRQNKLTKFWSSDPYMSSHQKRNNIEADLQKLLEIEKQTIFKKLGVNPTAKKIYETLEATKKPRSRQKTTSQS